MLTVGRYGKVRAGVKCGGWHQNPYTISSMSWVRGDSTLAAGKRSTASQVQRQASLQEQQRRRGGIYCMHEHEHVCPVALAFAVGARDAALDHLAPLLQQPGPSPPPPHEMQHVLRCTALGAMRPPHHRRCPRMCTSEHLGTERTGDPRDARTPHERTSAATSKVLIEEQEPACTLRPRELPQSPAWWAALFKSRARTHAIALSPQQPAM